jgi:hypothetical protein
MQEAAAVSSLVVPVPELLFQFQRAVPDGIAGR